MGGPSKRRGQRGWGSIGPPAVVLAALLTAACASAAGPRPGPGRSALPPIPFRDGPLEIRVAYPDSLDRVAVRDSNFVFGSVGTGRAELTINGHAVTVRPNGAFLAWLPLPEPSRGDTVAYRLTARAGGETKSVLHRFRVPPRATETRVETPGGRVWMDTASLPGGRARWALPGEPLELSLEAAPGLDVWMTAEGRRHAAPDTAPVETTGTSAAPPDTARADSVTARAKPPMRTEPGRAGGPATGVRLPMVEADSGRYRVRVAARRLAGAASGFAGEGRGRWSSPPGPGADTLPLVFAATDGRDTVTAVRGYPLRLLDPRHLPVTALWEAPDSVHGRARVVVGRPVPYGSYHWRFPDGTRAAVDARLGDRLRLRLAPGLRAWSSTDDAVMLEEGTPSPRSVVGSIRARPMRDRIRIRVPLEDRLPLRVGLVSPRELSLTLYGAYGATERMAYGREDSFLEAMEWRQLPGGRYRLRVRLAAPLWGYRVVWEGVAAGAGGQGPGAPGREAAGGPSRGGDVLRLDVRRPPELDPDDPLSGRRIAVDPGHPPAGAEGPTGLQEAEANMAVARELVRMLREAGAEPFLVRTDTRAVGLYERRNRARARGAELLVSIHNNALPDGVRPFGEGGTSAYYYHPHSRTLARAVQHGMLRRMGLRDLGVLWGNLAIPRTSWMPSVLTEGAFMMMPRHEAALRTDAFRRAYALGVLDGIRSFLRHRARGAKDDRRR